MSCDFCDRKFGLLTKKAENGKCWACQRSSCNKCSPLFDGRELGWVKQHPCCPKCVEALERQKKKTQSQILAASQKEAISKAVGDLPAWSLPEQKPPTITTSDATAKTATATPSADPIARLKPVGSSREDARRASRVLLQAVIENYADRDSFQTPEKGGGSSEDDELSSDLETPPVLTSPAVSSDALKTPVSAVRTAEQQRRLSRGVLASLDSLSQTAAAMNSSYVAPKQDDKLVEELATPHRAVPENDDDFERELKTLDLPPAETPIKPFSLNISQVELGHVSPGVSQTQRMEAELFDGEELRAEVGEDLSDAALNAQINSLDSVLLDRVQADPVSHIAEALSSVASTSNVDASIALHEDMIEVLNDVRREERDARMVAMLDGVEAKLKESLVKVSTPKVKRKQNFAGNLFHVGQVVSARNVADNCWYSAKVIDTEAEEGQYVVEFLAQSGRKQICNQATDLRNFLVGTNVMAVYRADGLGLMQEAIVDYIAPPGLYHVRFLSDNSKQLCTEADVKPVPSVASPRQPAPPVVAAVASAAPVVDSPVVRKAANPNMVVGGKDRVIRDIQAIEFWVNEQKSFANQCGLVKQADRKALLVAAQLLGHTRKIFEQPSVDPFELRLQDTTKGEAALYAKLQQSVVAAADSLLQKLGKLALLLAHPKAAERVDSVGKKVRAIRDFIDGASKYTAQV